MKKSAQPGNRRGKAPARMVGRSFGTEIKRSIGTEAKSVNVISRRIHGWSLLLLFISLQSFAGTMSGQKFPMKQQQIIPQRVEATPEEWEAASGIEALMIDNLLQEMRKSVPENELIPVSHGEKVYRQMLDSEYARMLSNSGSIGIADMVVAEMKRKK